MELGCVMSLNFCIQLVVTIELTNNLINTCLIMVLIARTRSKIFFFWNYNHSYKTSCILTFPVYEVGLKGTT